MIFSEKEGIVCRVVLDAQMHLLPRGVDCDDYFPSRATARSAPEKWRAFPNNLVAKDAERAHYFMLMWLDRTPLHRNALDIEDGGAFVLGATDICSGNRIVGDINQQNGSC